MVGQPRFLAGARGEPILKTGREVYMAKRRLPAPGPGRPEEQVLIWIVVVVILWRAGYSPEQVATFMTVTASLLIIQWMLRRKRA